MQGSDVYDGSILKLPRYESLGVIQRDIAYLPKYIRYINPCLVSVTNSGGG